MSAPPDPWKTDNVSGYGGARLLDGHLGRRCGRRDPREDRGISGSRCVPAWSDDCPHFSSNGNTAGQVKPPVAADSDGYVSAHSVLCQCAQHRADRSPFVAPAVVAVGPWPCHDGRRPRANALAIALNGTGRDFEGSYGGGQWHLAIAYHSPLLFCLIWCFFFIISSYTNIIFLSFSLPIQNGWPL